MSQFDDDLMLTPARSGIYQVNISDSWQVIIGPNGGYIGALILFGMKRELAGHPAQTRSITCHFLSASTPGPARLAVTVEKLGRSLATATARLTQGERTIAVAIATFGAHRGAVEFCDIKPPSVTPADRIDPARFMQKGMAGHAPFRDNFEQRLAIGPIPPQRSTRGHVGGWVRFRDQRPFDDLAMVAILDSWYPSFMARPTPGPMHAPTVDYTVHMMQSLPVAQSSADDFVLAEFETVVAAEGYAIEDGKIWTTDGMLIARSRQLAMLLPR